MKPSALLASLFLSSCVASDTHQCCSQPSASVSGGCSFTGLSVGQNVFCCPDGGALSYEFTPTAHVECYCDRPQNCSVLDNATEEENVQDVPLTKFQCADGQLLPIDVANDDFCDCRDGSDEPNTSACSPRWRFLCSNGGFKPSLLRTSRVGDGICDCCDGSDEADGVCEDTCRQHQQEYEVKKLARDTKLAQGIAYKDRLLQQKESELADYRKDASEQEKVIMEQRKVLDAKRDEMVQETLEETKEKEAMQNKLSEGAIEKALKLDQLSVDQLAVAIARLALMNAEQGGEILMGLVGEFESGKAWLASEEFSDTEFLSFVKNAKGDDAQVAVFTQEQENQVVDMLQLSTHDNKLASLAVTFAQKLSDIAQLVQFASTSHQGSLVDSEVDAALALLDHEKHTRPEATAAREAHEKQKKQVKDLETVKEKSKKVASLDFGPQDILYVLFGECTERKFDKYMYKVCPFDTVKQAHTLIGKFEGPVQLFKDDGENPPDVDHYSVAMSFSAGQNCFNVGPRSAVLYLTCGPKHEIQSVEEPETCKYIIKMESPAACFGDLLDDIDPELLQLAQEKVEKDEASLLQKVGDGLAGVWDAVKSTVVGG